jgi:hypothetical protein
MDAIGLNPIKLDAIGLDPIRMNAIRLGVPGASSGSGRPYIDPELLKHVKMAISTWGKSNDDPDRAILKDLSGNGNDMRLLNFSFTEGSGYGLPRTDFEGALITDGIDDQIVSTKTIQEMLGGSNDITVVSMIYHINSRLSGGSGYTNYIDNNLPTGQQYFRNKVISQGFGKWGIYGYSSKNNAIPVPITNILGDKADYSSGQSGTYDGLLSSNAKFSPIGRSQIAGSDTSSCAWYWTILADKVLTTDEINQIIAYFNLDRPGQIIKPQLYCNIKKQGITNDNHAEFNDQLIDFINGHNIQLNNIGWEGESGINSYPVVLGINKTFKFSTQWKISNSGAKMSCVDIVDASLYSLYYNVNKPEDGIITTEIPSFTIKVSGITDGNFGFLRYGYLATPDAVATTEFRMTTDGTYTLPKCYGASEVLDKSKSCYVGFSVEKTNVPGSLTIEVLPTIEHALCLDGINDFGKVTDLSILKDYTVAVDREILNINGYAGILSKAKTSGTGAFLLEPTIDGIDIRRTWSFGSSTDNIDIKTNRQILYQSKYIYNQKTINAGTQNDGDTMWIATLRDNSTSFSKVALWSLMLFPYSLSEFLLERQLKKYNAGTLYPDMIEFRPVIKSNVPYSSISYSVNPGVYVAEGSTVTITITLSNASDKLIGVSSNAISDISISGDNGVYEVTGKVTKSPQKINIVISSYLTMLNNETLISNETLIKNE